MSRSRTLPSRSVLCCLGLALTMAGACSNDQSAKKGDDTAKKAKNSKADSDKAKGKDGADASKKGKAGDKSGGDAKKPDAKSGDCCKYCVDSSPCGDSCVDEGAECKSEGEGCACPFSERPAPRFKKGDRALAGLIAADLPAYNKAQEDPIEGVFTLEAAFEGDAKLADKSAGKLTAIFDTTMGKFECELYEDGAPSTVASFVGLGRGKRPYRDSKTKEWTTGNFYDGVLFHRVIEGFMIQTGDKTGTGRGGPGFFVPDEFDKTLRHNKPGILSMANRNRVDPRTQKLKTDEKTGQTIGNTGSSQFFVTTAKTSQLDDRHTVFGACDGKVPTEISKVKVRTNRALGEDHKPVEQVKIKTLTFTRK